MIPEINGAVICWYLCEEISTASPSGFFKSIILEHDKPSEGAEVSANDIGSHHVEHLLLRLQVVHEAGEQQKDHARYGKKVELMGHEGGVRVLHAPCTLITSIAFVFLKHHEIPKHSCENQHKYVVDRSDLLGDNLVHVAIKVFFKLTDAFLVL